MGNTSVENLDGVNSSRGGKKQFTTIADGDSVRFTNARSPGLQAGHLIWTNCRVDKHTVQYNLLEYGCITVGTVYMIYLY